MKPFFIFILLAFCLAQLPAQTLAINATTAEAIALNGKTRTFYNVSDLVFIYRASTDGFEAQIASTRSKVWGGDIDSVTITGASTAALKLAKLRTWAFESTTTNGYRSFMPRRGIKWHYIASLNRLEIKHASNDQMLWFGSIDSFQVAGVTGATNKLLYLRTTANRVFSNGILGGGAAVTVAAGAALGTSPTISVVGDATSGEVTFTTGSGTTATGVLFTVTFPTTAPTGNNTVWSASDEDSGGHVARMFGTNTSTTFVQNAIGTALTAGGTQYKIKYVNASY